MDLNSILLLRARQEQALLILTICSQNQQLELGPNTLVRIIYFLGRMLWRGNFTMTLLLKYTPRKALPYEGVF